MDPREETVNLEYSVMATSYGLLLYLAHNQLSDSIPIMKFLVAQHKAFNYWSSSQVHLFNLLLNLTNKIINLPTGHFDRHRSIVRICPERNESRLLQNDTLLECNCH